MMACQAVGGTTARATAAAPKLLTSGTCESPCPDSAFRVRPRVVSLQPPAGGDLHLKWSSWTATKTTASGTSHVMHQGHSSTGPVIVTASAPTYGRYTTLRIRFTGKYSNTITLHLHDASWQ
jgi:hypothetical protein